MPQQVYMSRRAFIPPMVCAWCMHGPFSTPSRCLSAFEFLASMIHPCWTATTTPWCPGTHSGLRARRPTAYPRVEAHSQHIAVAPYHHTPTIASLPQCSCTMAYAHAHLHHMQPTAMLHHCCHCSSLTRHHHCRHLCATAAAVYMPLLPLSMCHRHCHLHVSPLMESMLMCHGIHTPTPPPHATPHVYKVGTTLRVCSALHHCCLIYAHASPSCPHQDL